MPLSKAETDALETEKDLLTRQRALTLLILESGDEYAPILKDGYLDQVAARLIEIEGLLAG